MTVPDWQMALLIEDASYLRSARDLMVDAPTARLLNLVRLDERVDAYIDALALLDQAARRSVLLEKGLHEWGSAFAAGAVAGRSRDADLLVQLTRRVAGAETTETADVRGLVAALAWGEREGARWAIETLSVANETDNRPVVLAALGARRTSPDPSMLESALGDPSPVVRARACRVVGQLGQADLMARLRPGLTDPDPECRFWSAWAAARMGAGEETLGVLAEIAWTNQPRAVRALDLLLRCLEVPHANAWLREFAKLPDRQRDLIRATGVVGDPVYVPWLIERMVEPETARLAGEAFSMITGIDLAYRDLDRRQPLNFESGPNDDQADENVALDVDDGLPWPDPGRIGSWWLANLGHYNPGTAYFLGAPKPAADWLGALSDAFQRQRHAAALELAIRMPKAAMFEVRARGRLQRDLIARSRGLA